MSHVRVDFPLCSSIILDSFNISVMNVPFFFLKSLQKMSCRVREHQDHTEQSVFHHGLIKLIISTVLHKRDKTWEHFLFLSGFKIEKEEQSQKRQLDKGLILIKKLKNKVIVKDEEADERGKALNQENENIELGK